MWLLALLALALAARTVGIGYGLPWLFYFHDEPQIVLRALRLGTGDLNPHFFIWPGTLLLYLALAAYGALFVIGRLCGWWAGREGFAAAYFADPSIFYLLARFESVGFGVATVGLAYALGRAGWEAPVGLAAALGLALNALAAHYAHLAHPVTAMTAFVTLGLWAAVRLANGGTARHLAIASLATGLGVACQYHAALLAAPIGTALLLRAGAAPAPERPRWLLRGVIALAGAVAVFLIVCPYSLLDFATFRGDLTWITHKAEGSLAPGAPAARAGLVPGLIAFWRECLHPGLGIPLALAAGAGALLALVRRTRADLVLLSFVAAYLLLVSRATELNDRYAIPLTVPALVLAASGVAWALARLALPAGTKAWAVPLAMLALCLPPALTLIETDVSMTRGDTRIDALRWFEAHVPGDERVVIDMSRFWNSASPPLAENRERLGERLSEAEGGFSGGGHSAAYADFYRYRMSHPHQPAYYLRTTDMGDSVRTLAAYRADGFRWAVVSDLALSEQSTRARRGDSTGVRYYAALEREATLAAEFRPERWQRLGPRIRIYRLDAAPRGTR
jgi:hypothetical protein